MWETESFWPGRPPLDGIVEPFFRTGLPAIDYRPPRSFGDQFRLMPRFDVRPFAGGYRSVQFPGRLGMNSSAKGGRVRFF